MKSLYAIATEILSLLDTADGELPPDLEAHLDALQGDAESKLERCCAAVRSLAAEKDALKAEAARFSARAASAESAEARLKGYILDQLQRLGQTKMDAGMFKVRIQANSQPAVIFDGNPVELPGDFQRVEYSLDNKAAVAAWNAKQALPDGVTVKRGVHLRIS